MGKRKEKRSFKGLLLKLAMLSLSVYVVVMLVQTQIDIVNKKTQLDDLKNQAQALTEDNKELKRLLTTDGEKDYIERIARGKLGYASPNERIFIDMAGQ